MWVRSSLIKLFTLPASQTGRRMASNMNVKYNVMYFMGHCNPPTVCSTALLTSGPHPSTWQAVTVVYSEATLNNESTPPFESDGESGASESTNICALSSPRASRFSAEGSLKYSSMEIWYCNHSIVGMKRAKKDEIQKIIYMYCQQ